MYSNNLAWIRYIQCIFDILWRLRLFDKVNRLKHVGHTKDLLTAKTVGVIYWGALLPKVFS